MLRRVGRWDRRNEVIALLREHDEIKYIQLLICSDHDFMISWDTFRSAWFILKLFFLLLFDFLTLSSSLLFILLPLFSLFLFHSLSLSLSDHQKTCPNAQWLWTLIASHLKRAQILRCQSIRNRSIEPRSFRDNRPISVAIETNSLGPYLDSWTLKFRSLYLPHVTLTQPSPDNLTVRFSTLQVFWNGSPSEGITLSAASDAMRLLHFDLKIFSK